MTYRKSTSIIAGVVALVTAAQAAVAGPIYWTPSSGSNAQITYSDGQSDKGLFGNPTVVGGTFAFLTPHDFAADAANGTAETTSDRLSFKVAANAGSLPKVSITELGDWSILGGTAAVKDSIGLFVTDLDGNNFGYVFPTTAANITYTNDQTNTTISSPNYPTGNGSGTWKAVYTLPLPANTKSVQIVLNNILQATAGSTSTSFIEKKSINITVTDPLIPEPASLALIFGGGTALLRRRRAMA